MAHYCRILPVLVLLAALAGCAGQPVQNQVVGVPDGDTIEVYWNGRMERVRLHGIDCPELGQSYGRRAKNFTKKLAAGEIVILRTRGRDAYGRLICVVELPDGRNLNRELVRQGYAWWYKRYSNDKELRILEADARRARRGLWADPQPIPPWEFRKSHPRKSS